MACGTIRGCTINKDYCYIDVVCIQIIRTGVLIEDAGKYGIYILVNNPIHCHNIFLMTSLFQIG